MKHPYEDILHLPRPVSKTRPQMPRAKRAAQFMPFAALAGYEAAIAETARQTEERITLAESAIALLDRKLALLADAAAEQPEATITYFLEDEKKQGGTYVTLTGRVKTIHPHAHTVIFTDGASIPIGDIIEIDSGLFPDIP